jgi:peptidoglycan/LPS O-acetylase OafA/YrhL
MSAAAIPAAAASETELHLASSSRRIPQLDGLRGFAILLVLAFHYTMLLGRGHQQPLYIRWVKIFGFGWSGVDLFFVLSGFLIGGILLEARNSGQYFKTFYVRRIYRIFPLYYLWLFLYFTVLLAGVYLRPAQGIIDSEDLFRFPRYLFFLQNCFYDKGVFELAWLSPMWSLAVEEQFYLIAPLLIRFLSPRTLTVVLFSTVLIAPLVRAFVGSTVPYGFVFATALMPCRADSLAMGMLGAIAVRSSSFTAFLQSHPKLLARIFLTLGLGILCLVPWYFSPANNVANTIGLSWLALFWLSLLLLVFCFPSGIAGRISQWKLLQRAGALSYCMYLIHAAVYFSLRQWLVSGQPRVGYWQEILIIMLAFLLTWTIAGLSWKYFEQPMLRRGHSYSY